jgi:hypothetical protein
MSTFGRFLTISVLCICNGGLVNADEEASYGGYYNNQTEEASYGGYYNNQTSHQKGMVEVETPTVAYMILLCLFSTLCYVLLLGPFWFGPRLKRDIRTFKVNGVPTQAALLSQSIKSNDSGETHYNVLLVRFTNAKGQRIEKEMIVDQVVFDEIQRENSKTLTIYIMPDLPFSASLGDGDGHEEYSLLAKIFFTVGGFSLAAPGVYCFILYLTYFDSLYGFGGMILMQVVVAVFFYWGMERLFDYRAKTMDYQVGGSVVYDDDPAPMLGVSNTATSAGHDYSAMGSEKPSQYQQAWINVVTPTVPQAKAEAADKSQSDIRSFFRLPVALPVVPGFNGLECFRIAVTSKSSDDASKSSDTSRSSDDHYSLG